MQVYNLDTIYMTEEPISYFLLMLKKLLLVYLLGSLMISNIFLSMDNISLVYQMFTIILNIKIEE